ncbi:MAG: hypothetical protein HY924_12020 [Elusimicrobia bacterium]|nr:hypothetical protein [Elusimicrobiota bacterium]
MNKPTDDRIFGIKCRVVSVAAYVLNAGRTAFFLGALFLIGTTVLSRFQDADTYPASQKLLSMASRVEQPVLGFLQDNFPTKVQGKDVSRLMLIAAAFIFSSVLSRGGKLCSDTADAWWDEAAEMDENDVAILGKLGRLRKGKLTRGELMEVIAHAQKALERHKQKLAFLSIDVVNSTGMKAGEDPAKAEKDFIHYKNMVEEILRGNHAFKSAWTPDGVMICFLETRDAVRAGQALVKELKTFNKEVKSIKHDFAVRIGINTGDLLTEDSVPMEAMTDRVIDIAGHMQKHGAVDAVSVSEHAIKPLLAEFPFVPAGRVVDGCPVYEWRMPAEETAGEPDLSMDDAVPA